MIFDQVSAVTSPIVTAVVLKKARRLLLDIYGGAKAAYSLRAISEAWRDQDIVEVRRAWDDTTRGFTADDIGDGTRTNWVGTGATDHGYVATWYDQSGNGNDAVQNVATSQPKIIEGGVLVADGIQFDGHHLACGSLLSGDQSRSTFTVAAPENDQFFHSFGTLNYNGSMWSLSAEVAMRCKVYVWVSSTPATYFQNNLITNTYSGGSLFSTNAIYLNGNTVTKTSGTDGTVNTDPIGDFKIASLPSGSSTYVGAISEIIIYNSDQSAKRTGIEGNINDYYDIFADETYRRPDGSAIFRPDGTSVYERP